MPNLAVIDCGTNTFHLLIARPDGRGGFEPVHRERRYVKLAEEGIERIGERPYRRALHTLIDYAQIIADHDVVVTRVSGTAALRTAANGPRLRQEVREKTGLDIVIIPGKEEARLIYTGVKQAIGPQSAPWLVMDIGGGSVEFIIVDAAGVRWFESFPVGVAVLYKKMHRTEPISTEEIELIRLFLRGQLTELSLALSRFPTHHLVGAAGTFDVIAQILGTAQPTPHCYSVGLEGFDRLYQRVISADRAARHAMADIPDDRADMIVVALILVQLVLEMAQIDQLTVSRFSMKEGMLAEMMAEHAKE